MEEIKDITVDEMPDEVELSSLRRKANNAKKFRCNTLACVLENPRNIQNVGAVIRNIDTLGIGKLYIVDGWKIMPTYWEQMRNNRTLKNISSSAIKWAFVKTFPTTSDCLNYLNLKHYVNMVTSPHIKGRSNMNLSEGLYTQSKLAIWFGNETCGVTDEVIDKSIGCIQIEMSGIIESLNLSVSTGIVLWHIAQQRRAFSRKLIESKNYHSIFGILD